MGDLTEDTAVRGEDGRYTAALSEDWRIWGPSGGYVASIALRAAGAHAAFDRPATFSCHFLSVARFEPVELHVRTMRRTKRAESVAVAMSQDGVAVLEATAWFVAPGAGLVHDHAAMPPVAPHAGLPLVTELVPPGSESPFPFWQHFDHKPLEWWDDPADRPAGAPVFRGWYRYTPVATFSDPVVDACRSLILLDTMSWPSAVRAHPPDHHWMAPNLDVSAQFHRAAPDTEWLLADGVAPVAEDGLIGFRSHVWAGGALLASGAGQLLCRRLD
jgi:acyl-CoA thioesterase-2